MKFIRRILVGLQGIALALVCLWGSGFLLYSPLSLPYAGVAMATGFAVFGVWAIWFNRRLKPRLTFAATFILVLAWFATLPPSHDRVWRTDVAVMPRAIIKGDAVQLIGVRNFDFNSQDDYIVDYEDRQVSLSDLESVDLFISYWTIGPVAHTFLSFNFANSRPVSISIETRPESHEGYDPIASIFKAYELIYVVGNERDLVRWRTNYRKEEVYLYPIKASREGARRLFEVYLHRINELNDNAEWYHLLSNNCTLNIMRYANAAGRVGSFDIRHLLNGWIDRYFYDAGMIDNSAPFAKVRDRSRINDLAVAADKDPAFSKAIREQKLTD